MIDLRIKNQSLDLDPGTSISMEINNPVFAGDVLPGSFSMPFTIPASATNGKILGFPELINLAKTPKLRYEAELIVEGIPSLTGELIFRGFSNDQYKVNFQSQISLLGQLLQDLTVKDLDHQIIELLEWTEESHPYGLFEGYKYITFTVPNATEVPDTLSVTVNGESFSSDLADITERFQDVKDQIAEANIGIVMSFSPPLASQVQSIGFQALEYGIEPKLEAELAEPWTFFGDWREEYHPLILPEVGALSNKSLFDSDFVFPSYQNKGFYQEIPYMSGLFNDYYDDTFIFEFGTKRHSFIPMFSLQYVFKKIEEAVGINIVGDFVEDPDVQKLIFFNNYSLDHFENTNGEPQHTYMNYIDPRNHLPDIGLNELFLELGKMFSLGFEYDSDNKVLSLFSRNTLIQQDGTVDITSKTDPRYEINYGQNKGYTLSFKWDSKDLIGLEDPKMQPIIVGEGKEKVECKIHTVAMGFPNIDYLLPNESGVIHFSERKKMPVANQPGAWFGKEEEQLPRLLFFFGFHPHSNGGKVYPFASSDNQSALERFGNFNLGWQSETWGLYETWHRHWIEFLIIDMSIARDAYFSIIDLINFQSRTKYRIDQVNYMVKKLSYNVSATGLGPVALDLLKAE